MQGFNSSIETQLYNETHLFCITMASKKKTEKRIVFMGQQHYWKRFNGWMARIEIESLIESESSNSHNSEEFSSNFWLGWDLSSTFFSGDAYPCGNTIIWPKLNAPIQFPTCIRSNLDLKKINKGSPTFWEGYQHLIVWGVLCNIKWKFATNNMPKSLFENLKMLSNEVSFLIVRKEGLFKTVILSLPVL